MSRKDNLRILFAEFTGTAILALVVLMVANTFGSGTSGWYTALSAGAAYALVYALFVHISGGHMNPAVTLGLWFLKKVQTIDAISLVAFQLLGGLGALAIFGYITEATLPSSGSSIFSANVFIAELVGSVVLGIGYASVVIHKKTTNNSVFILGASYAAGMLIASLASEAYINPAVALANNSWDMTLVLAPMVGVTLGMMLYKLISNQK